jgi:hypothetical protein
MHDLGNHQAFIQAKGGKIARKLPTRYEHVYIIVSDYAVLRPKYDAENSENQKSQTIWLSFKVDYNNTITKKKKI